MKYLKYTLIAFGILSSVLLGYKIGKSNREVITVTEKQMPSKYEYLKLNEVLNATVSGNEIYIKTKDGDSYCLKANEEYIPLTKAIPLEDVNCWYYDTYDYLTVELIDTTKQLNNPNGKSYDEIFKEIPHDTGMEEDK